MGAVMDFMLNLGSNFITEKYEDKRLQEKMRLRLAEYIDRKCKENEFCSMAEEIDFQRIADYIKSELIDDARVRFFGNNHEREVARQTIMSKTKAYAKAQTSLGEQRAIKLVNDALKILRTFFERNMPDESRFLAATIVESIDESSDTLGNKLSSTIDANVHLAREGNFEEVRKNITEIEQSISVEHCLFPDYGFRYEDGSLKSVPLNDEAAQKSPPGFLMKCRNIRLGDEPLSVIDSNAIRRSYWHQKSIEFDCRSATKLLGNIPDPIQEEAKRITGSHIIMKPKPFPPAFPCSIFSDSVCLMDYTLMRIKERRDDGKIVFTNEEHEHREYSVVVTFDPQFKTFDFSIELPSPSNALRLKQGKFLRAINNGERIKIKHLDKNAVLFEGGLRNSKVIVDDDDLLFLERVVAVEEYFHVKFDLPDEFDVEQQQMLDHFYSLITEGKYTGGWRSLSVTFDVSGKIDKADMITQDGEFSLQYSGELYGTLMGQELSLKIKRVIEHASLLNPEKARKTAELLEDGDPWKVEFIPSMGYESIRYIDYLTQ